jgi:hypothetical protein
MSNTNKIEEIYAHIVFDTTQHGVVVAEFDLSLADLLHDLYIRSVGHVAPFARRQGRRSVSTRAARRGRRRLRMSSRS